MTAKSQPIPDAALKKHIAILGMNGSGKTSVAKSQIIEPALRAGQRVCNIDPTGVGWGLRLKADGKTKGFDIYIVGGEHADFPLQRRDGHTWGEIVGTSSDSFVFDTSQMTVEARSQWFTDFAETLLRKNRGPLVFVLDEAHLFAPQGGARSGGSAPAMLHATNNLLSLGRSKGLRITMISQRPAKLHKDSLTQAHTMIAMMVTAPQDRNAVKDWISDQADDGAGQEVIKSLSALAPGEGWVWAPREHVLERVKFAWPKTFDSSSAPDSDPDDGPKLTPIDPGAIKGLLEKVAKEKVANDPAALRSQIVRLQQEVADLRKDADSNSGPDHAAVAEAEQRAFERGKAAMVKEAKRIGEEALVSGLMDVKKMVRAVTEQLNVVLDPLNEAISAGIKTAKIAFPDVSKSVVDKQPTIKITPVNGTLKPTDKITYATPPSGLKLAGPLQKIADAIRWWNVLGVSAPTHAQVAFIAGYSHKSGTWSTHLSRLRSEGMIEGRGELALTPAGIAASNPPSTPPSGDALRSVVMAKIDAPLQRILAPILRAYPHAMSHADVAGEAGYSHSSGTWSTYLSRLRGIDLIEGRGELKAQGWLFP